MGFQNVPDDIFPNIELKKQGGKKKKFAGCILETSKDNLKALLGLVVLVKLFQSRWMENAKWHYSWQLRVPTVYKKQSFFFFNCFFFFFCTNTGSSKFKEKQSVDDNWNI